MKSSAAPTGIIIIVNACIWGFTMIMVSRRLSGTGAYDQIQHLLVAGAAMSLLVAGGGLAGLQQELKTRASKEKDE